MPITIQTVDPSDLIDNGRTKFNANDDAIALANQALDDQVDAHVGVGHPTLYHTKAEVESLIDARTGKVNVTQYYFGYDSQVNKNYYCGIEDSIAVVAGAGSVTKVTVTDELGHSSVVTPAPGTYPVAVLDRLQCYGDVDILPGDEINPLLSGILLNAYGANAWQLTALWTGIAGWFGYGKFSIMVEVTLS